MNSAPDSSDPDFVGPAFLATLLVALAHDDLVENDVYCSVIGGFACSWVGAALIYRSVARRREADSARIRGQFVRDETSRTLPSAPPEEWPAHTDMPSGLRRRHRSSESPDRPIGVGARVRIPSVSAHADASPSPIPPTMLATPTSNGDPQWTCDACTFHNHETAPACEMCGSSRGLVPTFPVPPPLKDHPGILSARAYPFGPSKILFDVDECPICLESFDALYHKAVVPCGHVFHEECIVEWRKLNGLCPNCNQPLDMTGRVLNALFG